MTRSSMPEVVCGKIGYLASASILFCLSCPSKPSVASQPAT
jgi:hypothetical protein